MGKPLSMDLRERVVSAVEKDGMSRRQVAARFGVNYRLRPIDEADESQTPLADVSGGAFGSSQLSLVAGARNQRYLHIVSGRIPRFDFAGPVPSIP